MHDAAVHCQGSKVSTRIKTTDRIENGVCAPPVGKPSHFFDEILCPIVDCCSSAAFEGTGTFLVRSGSNHHLGAKKLSERNARHTNAAGAAMDQEPLISL